MPSVICSAASDREFIGSTITELQKLQREVEMVDLIIDCQDPVEKANQEVGDTLNALTGTVSSAERQRAYLSFNS